MGLIGTCVRTSIIQHVLECVVGVKSGDTFNENFKVEFVLHHATKEEFGKNYWLAPDQGGEFVLDMGCKVFLNTVELVNTHNAGLKDRSTKRFQVFLRCFSVLFLSVSHFWFQRY